MQAFKAGAFNMIKEDVDRFTHEVIPRKYFSGGVVTDGVMFDKIVDHAGKLSPKDIADAGKVDVGEVMFRKSDDSAEGYLTLFLETSYNIPNFDPNDKLQERVRRAMIVDGDSNFKMNDEFGTIMAAATAFGVRNSEKKHLPILKLVYKARLSESLQGPDSDGFQFVIILSEALKYRLMGLAKEERSGFPSTITGASGRYGQLYDMLNKRLAQEGFDKEVLSDRVRYSFRQVIGNSENIYRQVIDVEADGRIRVYNAEHADVPVIMRHLTECWDIVMDGALAVGDRVAALAEYEWWFFQANPFGRGAASMGDAMSLIA